MKKNYYIQGDPARAEKIKAAFERLGINALDFGFADKTVVYCSIGECVQYLPYSINLMNILYSHPDYQELPLSVEPKFNVLDWIVRNNGSSDIPIQVYGLKNDRYLVTNMLGSKGQVMINRQDEWRLWTIEDAKDGDVLVCYSEVKGGPIEQAGIFKQYVGRYGGCSNTFLAHTGIDWDGDIIINGYMGSTDILPAAKEQRDLLFAKMKEAGYEWDGDKKELRKIQPHYDIANFHAGMPVLVRADNNCRWDYSVFSRITGNQDWQFAVCNGVSFTQCIPFDGNETLLGTTDPCDERYINW
jgi:hypothetical protein